MDEKIGENALRSSLSPRLSPKSDLMLPSPASTRPVTASDVVGFGQFQAKLNG